MTSPETSSCIEIETAPTVNKSIIWLHGLGADGSDFVPIIPELRLPSTLGIRFLFPHAPIQPITINNGYEMHAWYDIYALTKDAKIDQKGIASSVEFVNKLIEGEMARGIDSKNILLAGFSQGAAIAMTTGILCKRHLKGIIALSGYLPLADEVLQHASEINRQIPIFLAHGTADTIVPYPLAKVAYTLLRRADYPVTWYSYEMGHAVCAQEVLDMSQWIKNMFNET